MKSARKLLLIIFLIVPSFLSTKVVSQDFAYDWIRNAGGERWDLATDLVIDQDKNVYMTGGFEQTASFGAEQLISRGNRDIFMAKYDSTGTLLWLKQIGGEAYDHISDIEIDQDGNLLIVGSFQGIIHFENTPLISDRYMNAFIAKYSPNGNLIQVKQIHAETKAKELFIRLTNNSDFFLGGSFYNKMHIGTDSLRAKGKTDIFIARFKSDFSKISLMSISGFGETVLKDIEYLNSHYYTLIDFTDSIDVGHNRLYSSGKSDVLMLQVNINGNIVKEKQIKGFGKNNGGRLMIDDDKSIYMTCEFQSSIYFDENSLKTEGGKDILLMKTDQNFKTAWYKQIGSIRNEYSNALVSNKNGVVYLSGSYYDALKIDDKEIISDSRTADMFLAKFSPSGESIGLKHTGGSGNEYKSVIVNDPDNYLYMIGNFTRDYVFDTKNTETSKSISGANIDDIFIARFYDCDYADYPDVGTDTSFCEHGKVRINNTAQFQNNSSENNKQYQWNNGQTGQQIKVNKSGYYYVTVTDKHKCRVTSDSLYIDIHPLPEPDLGSDIWANSNETIELFGGYFESYQWGNGTENERMTIKTDNLQEKENQITLKVTDEFGCQGTGELTIFIENPNDPDKNKHLIHLSSSVYPNPSSGRFYIDLSDIKEPIQHIKVISFDGRLVYQQTKFTDLPNQIFLKTKGAHTVLIETETKLFFEKIIIQ